MGNEGKVMNMLIGFEGVKYMIEFDPNNIGTIEALDEPQEDGNPGVILLPTDVTVTFDASYEGIGEFLENVYKTIKKENESRKLRNHRKREWFNYGNEN